MEDADFAWLLVVLGGQLIWWLAIFIGCVSLIGGVLRFLAGEVKEVWDKEENE